jgi:NTE family protein
MKNIKTLETENINIILDNKIDNLLQRSSKNKLKKSILILSGGGVKGIAHIGVLKSLANNNLLVDIKTIVGASVGGIIAILYSIGYTPDDMYNFIDLLDIKKLKNYNPAGFLLNYGLDDGKKFDFVISRLLEAKNFNPNVTFMELYKKSNLNIILSTVCLNDKQVYYLSHQNTPDLSIMIAARMTSCVPIYFVPIKYKGKMYIDGGCIDDYPIQLFEDRMDEVIGVYLSENREYIKDITNMEEFLLNLMHCFFEGMKCNSIKGFGKNTILIKLPSNGSGVSALNFDINNITKKDLYDRGIKAANMYINSKLIL